VPLAIADLEARLDPEVRTAFRGMPEVKDDDS
jgi:hypothetical protein